MHAQWLTAPFKSLDAAAVEGTSAAHLRAVLELSRAKPAHAAVRGLRGRLLAFWNDAVPLAKELSHRAIGPAHWAEVFALVGQPHLAPELFSLQARPRAAPRARPLARASMHALPPGEHTRHAPRE